MGAHSTIRVTRMTALGYIMAKLPGLTDEQIEAIMDVLLDERLFNCRIVEEGAETDHDRL
jgi:hypothetical protein